jgi:release factor glutamine methyltransferase
VSFLDVSKKSLKVVKMNSFKFKMYERTKLINLDWSSSDWDRDLLDFEKNIKFDAIVTNPPYIPSAEIELLQKEVKYYDPLIALDGGKDGLDAYRLIFSKLFKLLKPNGKIFVEIGKNQEKFISTIGLNNGLLTIDYGRDLQGIIRLIVFTIK